MSAARWSRRVLAATCTFVAFILIAPTLVVIPMSFTGRQTFEFPPPSWSTRWYSHFFTDSDWYRSLLTSLEVAAIVAVLATVIGTAAAFGLVRGRFVGKPLVRALILAPMIVPVVIVAVGIYAVFLRWHLTGTIPGFVIAHTCLAVPFVVIPVASSLQSFDRRLETAATSLGAGPSTVVRTVTLPLIAPAALTGALFAFMTSFDEVVVSLFLVSPFHRTLPVQMLTSVTQEVDPTIAASSSMTIVLTTGLLLAASVLTARRSRRGL